MPKVSVIIPVYNVEKYIRRCLDSVCGSELSDIEIICVDDGSRDRSGITCDEYSRKDTRIRVIHKKNGGLSSARNAGMNAAKGKYLYFIDSDDFFHKDMLAKMVNAAEENNCETVMCGYRTIPDGRTVVPLYELNKAINPREMILNNHQVHSHNDLCFTWRFLFKRELIIKNNIRFNEKILFAEDSVFNLEALLNSKQAYVLGEPLYCYTVDNNDSIMKKPYNKNMEKSLLLQYDIKKRLISQGGLDKSLEFMNEMAEYYIKSILPMMLRNVFNGPEEDKKAAIERILDYEMFRDSTAQIGFNLRNHNLREYLYYLAVKYRLINIVYHVSGKGYA